MFEASFKNFNWSCQLNTTQHRWISESTENHSAAIMKRKNSEITIYHLSFRIFLLEGEDKTNDFRSRYVCYCRPKKDEFIPLSLSCKQVYRHAISRPSVHEGCWYVTMRRRKRRKLHEAPQIFHEGTYDIHACWITWMVLIYPPWNVEKKKICLHT